MSKKETKLGDIIKEILSNSSAHGLPNIYQSNNSLHRFLWIILFFGGVGAVIWQVSLIFLTYIDAPYHVDMELVFQPTLEFPSVTLCNVNPVRRLELEKLDGQFRSLFDKNHVPMSQSQSNSESQMPSNSESKIPSNSESQIPSNSESQIPSNSERGNNSPGGAERNTNTNIETTAKSSTMQITTEVGKTNDADTTGHETTPDDTGITAESSTMHVTTEVGFCTCTMSN